MQFVSKECLADLRAKVDGYGENVEYGVSNPLATANCVGEQNK